MRSLLPVVAAFFVAACLLAAPGAGSPQKKKLTSQNILELLDGGVSLVRIASLVQERGIDFTLTAQLQQQFSDAGADQDVISALRNQSSNAAPPSEPAPTTETPKPEAPAPPPTEPQPSTTQPASKPAAPGKSTGTLQVTSHPGGVDVYVDDQLKGKTTEDEEEGRLDVAGLKPGKHHLRAARDGFQTVEGDVKIAAGEAQEMPLYLSKTEAPAPPPAPVAQELPAGKKFLVMHPHPPIAGISSGGACKGWMIVNVGYVRFIATDGGYHKYLIGTSEMKEAKPDSGTGYFHIKTTAGRKFQFMAVSEKGNPVNAGPVLSEIRYSMGL